MSTPRTIKASEVRKGMRVRWEIQHEGATITTEGEATLTSGTDYASEIVLGDYRAFLKADHPVTVLADPEPEWVEGAWYWTHSHDCRRGVRQRVAGGWAERGTESGDIAWCDSEDVITVLGRVLVVDWPGDDVARTLEHWPNGSAPLTEIDKAVHGVADAIRTQGGIR